MQKTNRLFVLAILILSVNLRLYAQFGEEKILTQCEICGLQSLQSLDLNGDGNLDIVGTTNFNDALFWLKNDGKNNFSDTIILSSKFIGIVDGQWVDFDKDGDIDFLGAASSPTVANNAKHFMFIKNRGNGTFSDPEFFINFNISLEKLFLGDVDGDQDIDVVALASNLDQILVYKNGGNGLIHSVYSVIVASDVKMVGLEDFDQDKDLDILVHFYNQVNWEIAFLPNNGSGVFTLQRPSLRESLNFVSFSGLMDLNKDGLLDLVYTTPGNLLIQMNAGSGKLQNFTQSLTIRGGESVKLIKYADIDKDNDVDILMVVNKNSVSEFDFRSDIVWLKNEGDGTFLSTNVLITAPSNIVRFDLADFNKDQNLDILYGISGFDGILLGFNNGANAYSVRTLKVAAHGWITSISAEDIDGDRQNDIIATSAFDGKLTWYKNLGRHEFSEQKIISSAQLGVKLAIPVDLDGDNIKDLFTYYQLPDSRLSWYKNFGNGIFSNELIIYKNPNEYLSEYIVITDLDNDGDNDIVTGLRSRQVLAWYQNNGKGEFLPPQQIDDFKNVLSNLNGIQVADLDGNQLPDIVAAIYPGYLIWYKNKGAGAFTSQTMISKGLPGLPFNYRIVDIDQDKDNDIVAVAYNLFLLFENDGTGNFVEKQLINDLREPVISDLKIEDLDNDGDVDILVGTESYGDLVIWYQNDGKQHFTKQTIYKGKGLRALVATGDLDNDADLDVIFAERQFNKLGWYENLVKSSTTSSHFLQNQLKYQRVRL